MKFFDKHMTIKEKNGRVVTQEQLEKLDEMLTEYNVEHFFTYPMDATDGIANNDEDVCEIVYESKNSGTVFLVIALWHKTYHGLTDEKLAEAMVKAIEKLA